MVFQALWPLLRRAKGQGQEQSPSDGATGSPKLVMMTSSIGCLSEMEPGPGGSYGPSKAALNYLTKSLHTQHAADGLVAVALHPGWVRTRSGKFVASEWGFPGDPPVSVDDSVRDMLRVIDTAARDNVSGKLVTQTGDILPW